MDEFAAMHLPAVTFESACLALASIFRTTCLDRWLFSSLTEAHVVINQWLEEYNTVRPHGSLGGINPEEILQQWAGTIRFNNRKP